MWLTFLLGVVNLALSALGTLMLRLPGFDLTPVGMILIARGGEGIVLGSAVLTVSYMIPSPKRFAYIWLQWPTGILIGWLSLHVENVFIPILVFHAISIVFGAIARMFDGRYFLYTIINIGINVFVARVYTWL